MSARSSLRQLRPGLRLVVVLAMLGLMLWNYLHRDSPDVVAPGPAPPVETELHRVKRVVDGDTLLMEDGERIRLLGVDTPETVAEGRPVEEWGPEASAFTKDAVEGQLVRLAYDKERRDQYHRVLAYVYKEDGWFLNEELIRAGLSKAQLQFPYSTQMKNRFKAAEEEARRAEAGLWSR